SMALRLPPTTPIKVEMDEMDDAVYERKEEEEAKKQLSVCVTSARAKLNLWLRGDASIDETSAINSELEAADEWTMAELARKGERAKELEKHKKERA
ncbi:hypothetical protein PMAYCL1PPCAC_08722, partial [Pristionchus mayeri]